MLRNILFDKQVATVAPRLDLHIFDIYVHINTTKLFVNCNF